MRWQEYANRAGRHKCAAELAASAYGLESGAEQWQVGRMSGHSERVRRIAHELEARSRRQGFTSLRKSSVSHFVPDPRDPKHEDPKLDISELRHVLELDVVRRRCVAESAVTFRALLDHTLPYGLVPKLVPELEGITLGGAVAGCSVESMSFRYGGFHDSCRSYEVITGTGDVVHCSRSQEPLLFDMIHGSYGTLAVLTKLEFDLIPAEPFVRLRYLHFRSFHEFHAQMVERCSAEDVNFIDGIMHGPDHFVLCLGTFAREVPWTSTYGRTRIYYQSTRDLHEDYLTVRDYFFRYDAECHWLTRTLPIPGMETLPMRLLLGGVLLGSSNLLRWSERLRPVLRYKTAPDVVVDVFLPEPALDAFFRWYAETVSHYPVWVVPYRLDRPYPWIRPDHLAKQPTKLFIDCAVYGKRNDTPGIDYDRLLEDKTRELGGIKTLISRNQYDRATFWSIYDRERYETVKKQVDPQNLFRDLYDKVHRAG